MEVDLTAAFKTFDEFVDLYHPGDEKRLFNRRPLLMFAMRNKSLEDRYAIADFLLQKGAVVEPPNPYGQNVLHVLFGQHRHDYARDACLVGSIIRQGININERDTRGDTPLAELIMMGGSREQVAPIYRHFLLTTNLDVTTPNQSGVTLTEYASHRGKDYAVQWLQRYSATGPFDCLEGS